MAFKTKSSLSNKQQQINVVNIIDIRAAKRAGVKIHDLRCRPDGQYYYCTQADAPLLDGSSIVWRNPGLDGAVMEQAVADIIQPPGRLYVTKTISSGLYYLSYESQDGASNISIVADIIYSGDAGSDDIQGLIDGIAASSYTAAHSISISLIEGRRGQRLIEFQVYFGENCELYTCIPLELCIEGFKELKVLVQQEEESDE